MTGGAPQKAPAWWTPVGRRARRLLLSRPCAIDGREGGWAADAHSANRAHPTPARPRVCVVGAGTQFLGGLSYYTHRLAHALSDRNQTSAILMRRLLPRRLYPGAARVGQALADLRWSPDVDVCDGVDWWAIPSLGRAIGFLTRQRPDVVLLQWWTATVAHSYIALALVARATGARVVIEYHESQDPGEAVVPGAAAYARLALAVLRRFAAASVVHSYEDAALLRGNAPAGSRPVTVIPHGPYDQYTSLSASPVRAAPAGVVNVLFFGLIRPYKGLEDLVTAFGLLPKEQMDRFWLTIVGETWEGCVRPLELATTSPFAPRITVVNRFVHDDEVGNFFAAADAVALPYRRSSGSGPLHIAMSFGLPVIVTSVGGLLHAVDRYQGAIVARPCDAGSLAAALLDLPKLVGRRYADVHSWSHTADAYDGVIRSAMRSAPPVSKQFAGLRLPTDDRVQVAPGYGTNGGASVSTADPPLVLSPRSVCVAPHSQAPEADACGSIECTPD